MKWRKPKTLNGTTIIEADINEPANKKYMIKKYKDEKCWHGWVETSGYNNAYYNLFEKSIKCITADGPLRKVKKEMEELIYNDAKRIIDNE